MESNLQFMPRSSHCNKHEIGTNQTENGMRQRKVPSGPEFGRLVDEVEGELRAGKYGIKYEHLMISSLLFMDDISITSSYRPITKNAYSTGTCM